MVPARLSALPAPKEVPTYKKFHEWKREGNHIEQYIYEVMQMFLNVKRIPYINTWDIIAHLHQWTLQKQNEEPSSGLHTHDNPQPEIQNCKFCILIKKIKQYNS